MHWGQWASGMALGRGGVCRYYKIVPHAERGGVGEPPAVDLINNKIQCSALHCTALRCTALCCAALHCAALRGVALRYNTLHHAHKEREGVGEPLAVDLEGSCPTADRAPLREGVIRCDVM